METYTTQMDAARKGIVTSQIKTVAEKEKMPVEKLMKLVALINVTPVLIRKELAVCFEQKLM